MPTQPHRLRRDSYGGIKPGTLFGLVATLIALGTLVWSMSALVSSKADAATVRKIELNVEVIKTEQRMLIRAIAPGLHTGKE